MNARYSISRVLQMIGLFLLPFGIASQLLEKVSLGESMGIAAVGCLIFYIGYVLQPRT